MPSGRRNGVFISYARGDGEDYARALHERIAREIPAIDSKFDRVIMSGGVGWWEQIQEAISAVEILVLLMTPGSLQSETVRREWRYARRQGAYVYPVKCSADLSFESAPRWMKKAHFYDLDKEWDRFAEDLKIPRKAHRAPFMAADLPETFVQRPAEFARLKALLLGTALKEPVAIFTALQGGGGYGKTTMARALCHDEDIIDAFDDGILWITLGQSPDLIGAAITLYAAITGERPGFAGPDDVRHSLAELLKDKDALLVVDDVWSAAHLEPFRHAAKSCGLLVTTRQSDVAQSAKAHVKVDEMTAAEAAEMLSKAIDRGLPADFARIARVLGEWPLLLGVARGTIRQRIKSGDSVEGAIAYVYEALSEEGPGAFDEVEKSLGLTLRLLAGDSRRRFFELGIFREDAEIPIEVIAGLWGLSRFRTERELGQFQNAGLVEVDHARGVRVHDVLREYALHNLDDVPRLHGKLAETWKDPAHLRTDYAWRSFAWHLKESGQLQQLREQLFDFNWISNKLEATDTNALIEDYGYLSGDEAAGFLQEALRLSAHVLATDKMQLAPQLMGRLLDARQPEIIRLLEQVTARKGTSWLRPLTRSFASPGGPLMRTLAGSVSVWRVAITPDGRLAVSTSADSAITVWDLNSGAPLRTFKNHSALWAHAVAITLDGLYVLSVYEDNKVRVWDLESGAEVRTFVGHDGMVSAVALTPDSRNMISGSFDQTLKVWDFESGAEIRTLSGHTDRVVALAITPDGRRVVSASDDLTLKVWDLASGRLLHTMSGHRHLIGCVAVTPDGRRAISASEDRTLRLWDLDNGAALQTLSGHNEGVNGVAITPDGRGAISASGDKTLKIWDLENGVVLQTLRGHTDAICDVILTPDGRHAISASMDRTLRLWDLQSDTTRRSTGQQVGSGQLFVAPEACIAVTTHWVDSTSERHRSGILCRVWDMKLGTELRNLIFGNESSLLALTPTGRHAMSKGSDGKLKVWNFSSGAEVRSLEKFEGRLRASALTPDGRRAVVATDEGAVTIWNVEDESAKPIYQLNAGATCLLSPDGRWAIGFRWSPVSNLVDLISGKVARFITGAGISDFIAVSHNGRCVLCSSTNETVEISDLESGDRLFSLPRDARFQLKAVVLTPDGGRAVFVSYLTLSCWELKSRTCIATLMTERTITSCALTSDAETIVAVDDIGIVHFLRVEAG